MGGKAYAVHFVHENGFRKTLVFSSWLFILTKVYAREFQNKLHHHGWKEFEVRFWQQDSEEIHVNTVEDMEVLFDPETYGALPF
jgi:hypothetical protein